MYNYIGVKAFMKKYYYEENNFKLIQGDSFKVLEEIKPKSIDMIFADPPYFLSSDGISCSGGKMVSVNKGNWDKSISIEEKHKFNRKWIKLCYQVLKDNGTGWNSAKKNLEETFNELETMYNINDLENGILNNLKETE